MSVGLRPAGVAAIVALTAACSGTPDVASTTPAPDACDRRCLDGFVDRYLSALAAHDPSALPLAPDVVFIENNQRLRVGDGTWKTVTGLGKYRHRFADPTTGQAAAITVVQESGARIIYDVRLRVVRHQIAEIESMAVRDPAGAALYDTLGAPLPVFLETVPAAERLSRAEMAAVADKYFSGMERNDPAGDYSFFADDCNRLEHARQTTNVRSETYGHSSDTEFVTLTCRQQFETGFLGFVTRIRDRRYVVIDEERQSLFAFAFLDHNGTVRRIPMSGGRTLDVPPYFSVPRSLQVGEAWRIEGGKLRQIEMTLSEFPYGMRPAVGGDVGGDVGGQTALDAAPAATSTSQSLPAACDRACLKGAMHAVLQGLLRHRPAALPLAPGVRYTENGQRLGPGDGLWSTLTSIEGANVVLADPASAQAGYYGAIVENGTPGILAARLKVQGGLITQIEVIVVRQETAGTRGGTLTLFAPRLPYPFDASAAARAVSLLNEPVGARSHLSPAEIAAGARTVRPSMIPGGFVRERRTLVTDDETGTMLEVALVDIADPRSVPGASTGPFSLLCAMVSRVRSGTAATSASVERPVPFGMLSGWR